MILLKERGYPSQTISSEEAGYGFEPTPFQLASFGARLVHAVHTKDVGLLDRLLSCGISPNPCNAFGDSVLGLVCKRANHQLFSCLVRHGCDLRVCDSFGRTPLHHIAWAGTFSGEAAKLVLNHDLQQLLVQDKRGMCPLQYTRKEQWTDWIALLRESMDVYWPISNDPQKRPQTLFPRDCRGPHLPDPENAVSTELAFHVAAGTISPEEVKAMDMETRKNYRKPVPEAQYQLFAKAGE